MVLGYSIYFMLQWVFFDGKAQNRSALRDSLGPKMCILVHYSAVEVHELHGIQDVGLDLQI